MNDLASVNSELDDGNFNPMKQSCFQFRSSLPENPRRERSHMRAVFNFAAITLEKAGDGKRKLRITRKSTYAQSSSESDIIR